MAGAVRCDDSPARVVFARPRSFYWEGAGRPVVYKTRRHGTELTPHVAVSRRCAFRIAVGAPPYSPEEVPHEPLFPAAPFVAGRAGRAAAGTRRIAGAGRFPVLRAESDPERAGRTPYGVRGERPVRRALRAAYARPGRLCGVHAHG